MSERVYLDIDSVMARIRQKAQDRGAIGIRGIGRLFRIGDDDGSRGIDLRDELPKLLGDIGILLNKTEIEELGRMLDRNGDGMVSFDEFLYYFAPPMSAARVNAVNEVFTKLDANGNDFLELSDLEALHPPEERLQSRQAAKMSPVEELFRNLLTTFEKNGDGKISRQEFLDYYRETSVNYDNDEYFIDLLHSAWSV